MVEEPFVNLRTAIESTRQAVLLKYYNELLELDPKTQPKQITAVTRCVDTLERHSREQEEQQTDNDIDKMIAEGRLPGEYVQRYRWCKRAAYYFSSIVSAIDETDAYDLPEGEKHPYEEFASRFWEEVACRYWAAKDEVKKDMEENANNGSGGDWRNAAVARRPANRSGCPKSFLRRLHLRLPLPKDISRICPFRRSPQRHGAWDRKEVLLNPLKISKRFFLTPFLRNCRFFGVSPIVLLCGTGEKEKYPQSKEKLKQRQSDVVERFPPSSPAVPCNAAGHGRGERDMSGINRLI